MAKLCEMCDEGYGIRREDNIYVCFECDQKHPIEESKVGCGFMTKEHKRIEEKSEISRTTNS